MVQLIIFFNWLSKGQMSILKQNLLPEQAGGFVKN